MENEIHVFIVENDELARQLVKDHFEKGQITYAATFPESDREEITRLLDLVWPAHSVSQTETTRRQHSYAKAYRHPELVDQTIWDVFEAERLKLVPYAGHFDGFRDPQWTARSARRASDPDGLHRAG